MGPSGCINSRKSSPRSADPPRSLRHRFGDRFLLSVAYQFDSPLDVLRHSPTFQHADVGGVGKYLHQFGGHSPTAELAQYAVPGVERLYLAGTFMHPPGGVTGGGRATAVKMCGDLGLDFDRLTK